MLRRGNARSTEQSSTPTKLLVPGVTITVTNQATGLVRTTVSGSDGRFVVPTLTPGTYTLTVELQGFQPTTRPAVTLAVGQELTLDFTLGRRRRCRNR